MRSNNILVEIYGSMFKLFQKPGIKNRVDLLFQISPKLNSLYASLNYLFGTINTLKVTPVSGKCGNTGLNNTV